MLALKLFNGEIVSLRLFLLFLLIFPLYVSASVNITLPKPSNAKTPVNSYLIQLIEEAITAAGGKANIKYSSERMNQKRAMHSLEKGEFINLSWFTKTPEREQKLSSIVFPLYRGLHGVRLLIINESMKDDFAKVNSLTDLAQFVGLQKSSWSDYDVLIANGLNIDGSLSYQAMHKAIAKGLGDYFPRSAMTVLAEIRNNNDSGELMLEPTLSLHYESAYYFYVNKDQQELKTLLTKGLLMLEKSGRFEEIFSQFFSNRLAGLNLDSRKKLHLTMPSQTSSVSK